MSALPPAESASDLLDRVEADSGKPLRAMIEISDHCNEVCVHCYQVQGQKGELTTEHWRHVLDDLAAQGVLILTISGGEATLRADFLEIVAHARQLGFLVRLYTNGLRITRELAAALRQHAVFEVEISVYSTRADVHDFITGVPGSFTRTLEAIGYLVGEGVAVTIKTVAMSVNQAQLADYPAFAAALGVRFRLDTGGVMAREGFDRSPQALSPDPEVVLELEERLHLVRQTPESAAEAAKPARRGGDEVLCGAAREFHVEPNGELRPCTMLDLKLGQLRDTSAGAAYESQPARELRALRWRDVHGCRACDLAKFCSRCHAASLAETGDALGPYPSACAAARRAVELDLGNSPLRILVVDGTSAALGPYRWVAPAVYETVADTVTAEDSARAERLGWVRRPEAGNPPPTLAIRPGELVQIRRPGERRPSARLTRVPDGT